MLLVRAGFIAAEDEADELLQASNGDEMVLDEFIKRRLRGEPLAWIVGFVTFCGVRVNIHDGVYVPRWQSEPLVYRAVERLPINGTAIDVCTGSGAVAVALRALRPHARIVATELDERAIACARSNGVEVYPGDLFAGLPSDLAGSVDVIVGVVPYVPTRSLSMLPRDTFAFETTLSYDGGVNGLDVLRRVIRECGRFLKPSGALLLELGGDEAEALAEDLAEHDFTDIVIHRDEDGDVRALEATLRVAG